MQTWSHLTLTAQLFPGKSKMSLKHGSSIRATRVSCLLHGTNSGGGGRGTQPIFGYGWAAEGLKLWPCLGQKIPKIHTVLRTTPSISLLEHTCTNHAHCLGQTCAKLCTLSSGTSPYRPHKGVTPPPPPGVESHLTTFLMATFFPFIPFFVSLNFFYSLLIFYLTSKIIYAWSLSSSESRTCKMLT